jgi:putative oxidoreductase
MRLVVGVALIVQGLTSLRTKPPIEPPILDMLALALGVLLFAGLWTPVAGALVAILGFWNAILQPGDRWANILLGTIGAALALIGPGTWSIDARLFGWKRIDVQDRKN